ncbi:actin cytoskeleton-regulatory complex protein pan-1-like [Ischnura elegans]|uniref:actin cytoskeleton-regulatory complex protein pan-1-like n=1 Tax=Ischnura elegans TaxID=197161 RepID=UPI001ED8A386|nr:actin cytoskeleton-regulatory complex protein pan-1-like [Ischnura elegans]
MTDDVDKGDEHTHSVVLRAVRDAGVNLRHVVSRTNAFLSSLFSHPCSGEPLEVIGATLCYVGTVGDKFTLPSEAALIFVLPVQPWGATPAPPVAPRKPPVSRKPEGPWPRARVTPMPPPPPCKGVVNQGFQLGSPNGHQAPPSRRDPEESEEKRRRTEEDAVRKGMEEEERRKMEEEDRKRRRVEEEDKAGGNAAEDGGRRRKVDSEERSGQNGWATSPGGAGDVGPPPCKCGKEAAEEEAKLLKLHNVRLRQVASALASKLRASEAALGASRADADARLAALVRALLAFEAGLRREQSRIKSTMEKLEALVRAQKAEIAVLRAAGAAAGLGWEETGLVTHGPSTLEVELLGSRSAEDSDGVQKPEGSSWGRGIRPASILRDVLRSQLGAAWTRREEEAANKAKGGDSREVSVPAESRVPAEGEEKAEEGKVAGRVGGPAGTEAGKSTVKPPLPPRPRPRLTAAASEDGLSSPCREEIRHFRGRSSPGGASSTGDGGDSSGGSGNWGLNAHFEEFVLSEDSVSDTSAGPGDEPPSTTPPPPPSSLCSPSPGGPTQGTSTPGSSPQPTAKPRTALLKPPRKNPPPNKHQATTVSPPPMQFLLPDLLCPTPRGPEGVGEHMRNGPDSNGMAYLKENAMNGDHYQGSRNVNGVTKGRPLGPSALQNAITTKCKQDAVLEAAKGHCSYERFLEVTGLSQKSILTFHHRPIPPPPANASRPLPPPPPKHRSVLKPRDVKLRSKSTRTVGWEDGFVAGVNEAVVGPTRKYWSGPYL